MPKASSLLSNNVNVDSFNIENDHSSFNCTFLLDKNSAETIDGLPGLESSVPKDIKMVLMCMAGYIRRNDSGSSEERLLNETTFYHQKYFQYRDADRGGRMEVNIGWRWTQYFNRLKLSMVNLLLYTF